MSTASRLCGLFAIQARQEKSNARDVSADWFDLDLGSQILVDVPSNSILEHQIIFNELPFTDVRIVYAATSGTGTVNIKITAKQVGG